MTTAVYSCVDIPVNWDFNGGLPGAAFASDPGSAPGMIVPDSVGGEELP